jgi:ACDE family multidrug resistance protein
LQGVCNAFFTPLLLAGLTDASSPEMLGRRIGVYSSFQAAGGAMAPLVGGIAGDINWRYAFIATALVAGMLAITTRTSSDTRPVVRASLRSLVQARVILIGLAAFFVAAGPYGAAVLVGLKARDIFDLSATAAGLVILGGSVAGLIVAPGWGWLLDRRGPRVMSAIVMLGAPMSLVVVGLSESTLVLSLAWFVTGAFMVGIVVALQGLAATAVPENRAGAVSATMSFRFLGHALGPIIWVPVFSEAPTTAFFGSAALGLVAALSLWWVTGDTRVVPVVSAKP